MGVNVKELSAAVSEHLGLRCEGLHLNGFQGASSETFCGRCEDGRDIFVKVARKGNEQLERSVAIMKACQDLPFIPSILEGGSFLIDGMRVVCSERICGLSTAEIETLSNEQIVGLARGYAAFSNRLQRFRDLAVTPRTAFTPESCRALLSSFVCKHCFLGRLLSPLLAISETDCRLEGRELSVIHNDFGTNNYAFSENGLAAIYDYDSLSLGLPTEDLAFGFINRMGTAKNQVARRVRELFRLMVGVSPWTAAEWRFAVNGGRLLCAARELARHPKKPMIVFKVVRRDRRVRALLEELDR